jgi:hypothetical protein
VIIKVVLRALDLECGGSEVSAQSLALRSSGAGFRVEDL